MSAVISASAASVAASTVTSSGGDLAFVTPTTSFMLILVHNMLGHSLIITQTQDDGNSVTKIYDVDMKGNCTEVTK